VGFIEKLIKAGLMPQEFPKYTTPKIDKSLEEQFRQECEEAGATKIDDCIADKEEEYRKQSYTNVEYWERVAKLDASSEAELEPLIVGALGIVVVAIVLFCLIYCWCCSSLRRGGGGASFRGASGRKSKSGKSKSKSRKSLRDTGGSKKCKSGKPKSQCKSHKSVKSKRGSGKEKSRKSGSRKLKKK